MIDRVVAAGTPGEVFEPRQTTHGFQFAAHRGPSRPSHPRRRHRRRRAHRPAPHGLVPLQRRTAQPVPRHHRVVVPRQRLRNPDRLPAARAGRLDGRLAALHPDRRLPLRRGRLLPQVAARPRGRAARRRPRSSNYSPDPLASHISDTGRWLGMQGSSGWGDAIVMVPWEMWRAYGDTDVLVELWPNMVSWIEFAATAARTQRHESRAGGPPRARAARAVSLGRRLPLGRVDRARVREADDHLRIDQGSVGTAFLFHSAALAAPHRPDARSRRRGGPLRGAGRQRARRPGVPNSSAPTVHSRRTPRPTTCAPWPSAWSPDDLRARTAERLVGLIREAGHAPRHRLPGHAVPAAGAGRHRPSRRGLRAPPAGHAAVVAGHGRARRDDGLGVVGGHRRRTAVPHESLNHYSKGAVISFLHNYVAGISLLDGYPAYRRFRVEPRPGRRADLGRGRARLARTAASSRRGTSTDRPSA